MEIHDALLEDMKDTADLAIAVRREGSRQIIGYQITVVLVDAQGNVSNANACRVLDEDVKDAVGETIAEMHAESFG